MMTLSTEQIAVIKSTVPLLVEHGTNITTTFYKNMLGKNPDLFNIFNKTKQINGHQSRALAGALHAYAVNVDNLAALGGAVENITQKHASLFVKPEQYEIVGQYLLEALGEVLGAALTTDILDAWAAAYKQLANLMIAQELKLYAARADWTEWKEFKIAKKIKESEEITSFYLQPIDGKPLPSFRPGQYLSVRVHVPSLPYMQARQYSLSDAYHNDYYRISVKREDGANAFDGMSPAHAGLVSNTLHNMPEGDRIRVSHPHGDYYLSPEVIEKALPVVLISAGVGITPVMSMLNSLVASGSTQPISWIQAARRTGSQAFGKHISEICEKAPNVRSNIFIKNLIEKDTLGVRFQHVGRMDLARLDKQNDLLFGSVAEYYICGPDSFMSDIRKTLIENNVPESRIKMESFGADSFQTRT
ncbi:flavohemo protein [Bisporella sp. PMI_857]|nr:flavohemo protein [Bisporella sp. PMI_857]